MASGRSDLALVADIGGTNARFACFDLNSAQLQSVCKLPVANYPNIYEALDEARESLTDFQSITAACIAIAGPVSGDWVKASNSPWAFSRSDMQARYGWSTLLVINDFLAAVYGNLALTADDYRVIGAAEPSLSARQPMVAIGPGTGLGVAALMPTDDSGWRGVATEGGHARLAPGSEEDIALLSVLHRQLDGVQREDVLSGRGLCNLHRAWTTLHGKEGRTVSDPALLTAAALRDESSDEAKVLTCFCAVLGTVVADVALGFAAWGGVYLAGGILPRIVDFVVRSPFRERFENHPQFAEHLKPIPTVLVTEDSLGLLGAGHCLQQALVRE